MKSHAQATVLAGSETPSDIRPVDRIVHAADFERVLATRSRSRSAHFALHHLDAAPVPRIWRPRSAGSTQLSTGPAPICPQPVDDLPTGLWFGCVVPKRHARRAVTRNLIKRQIRSAFDRFGAGLPAGLWLVRLQAPFSKTEFVSARSPALAAAARTELETLLSRVTPRVRAGSMAGTVADAPQPGASGVVA